MYGRVSSRSGAKPRRSLGELLGEGAEGARRAEQSRVQEVEERPEIDEPVLDGRARQRDPASRAERLDGAGLLGAGVLDGLRLVENDQRPLGLGQPRRGGESARTW